MMWASWIACFAVAETVALRSGDHDATLSAAIRAALHAGTCTHPRHRRAGQAVFAVFVCWLAPHIWASRGPGDPCNR